MSVKQIRGSMQHTNFDIQLFNIIQYHGVARGKTPPNPWKSSISDT